MKIKNIKQIEPAFDDSYVVLQEYGNSSYVNIYHINRLGKIVFEFDSYVKIGSLVMPEEDKIFVPSKGFIIFIDLKSQSEKKFKCNIGSSSGNIALFLARRRCFAFNNELNQKWGLPFKKRNRCRLVL